MPRKLLSLLSLAAILTAGVPVANAAADQSSQLGQNILTHSEQFDNAAWTKTNMTVTADATTAPDGTVTAELITASGAGAVEHLLQQLPGGNIRPSVITESVFLKYGTAQWVFVASRQGSAWGRAWFDVKNGALGTVAAGSTNSMTYVGNGWYRCSVTFLAIVGGSSFDMDIVPTQSNGGTETYTQTGESVYAWGAQILKGAKPGAYNRTVASAINTDAYNYLYTPTGASQSSQKGQNLFQASQDPTAAQWSQGGGTMTFQKNVATAPDGTTTAGRLTDSVTNGAHPLTVNVPQLPTVVGGVYTMSIFVKYENHPLIVLAGNGGDGTAYVTVNAQTGTIAATSGANQLSSGILYAGNGWYRAWNTFVADVNAVAPTYYFAQSVGVLSYAGTGTDTMQVWGMQNVRNNKPGAYNRTGASALNSTYVPAGVKQSNQKGQNLIKYSQDLGNAGWPTGNNAGVTATSNVVVAPDGTMTGSSLAFAVTTSYTYQTTSLPSGTYTFSAWLYSPSKATIAMRIATGTAKTINLTTGWARYSVTATLAPTETGFDNRVGVGGDGIAGTVYVWGAQLVAGSKPGAYNRTGANAVNP